jgi:pimeloyl-ACP methyl ester carboxylesterase
MPYDWEHHEVQTNGITLHVVQSGPSDGPLVLLLHGFPEFWYGWRKQIDALADAGYRVWVPDQRGYNLSEKPPHVADYQTWKLAADVVGLIDAAGREKAFIVGHDWGGIIAWNIAMHHAARVERVAILNVPHPAARPRQLHRLLRQLRKSWYILFFQLPWLPEGLTRLRNWWFGRKALRGSSRRGTFSNDDLQAYQAAWAQPGAMRSMINWYRAAVRFLLRGPKSRRVAVPVHIIWGRRDAFLNAELAELSLRHCDNGWLTYFDKATHWVQHEEAPAVNKLLLSFFTQEEVTLRGM